MKPGYKTTEFWIVVCIILFCLLLASGYLKPSHLTTATERIQQGADALPGLIGAVKALFDKYAELIIAAAVGYAYLKKRSNAKANDAQIKLKAISKS